MKGVLEVNIKLLAPINFHDGGPHHKERMDSFVSIQKQPSFAIFTGKAPVSESRFNKVTGLKASERRHPFF